jgi:GNAT superfamily N-acetyltransferase
MVEIVPLEWKDLSFAKSLTDAERWARSDRAWRRILRVQPDGLFQALLRGEPVGIVGIFWYDEVAWVHSLIVARSQRGNGVGSRLVDFCREEAARRGIPALKLDAAPGTAPFYQRLGWRSEFPSLRFLGTGHRVPHSARAVGSDEVGSIVELDRSALGWNRSHLIRELIQDEPDGAFAVGPVGNPEGYVCSAPAEGRVEIGPVVVPSHDVHVARELVRAVLNRWPGKSVRCCVPGSHAVAAELMAEFGFEQEPPSTRMAFGAAFDEATAQFLMAGPAEG